LTAVTAASGARLQTAGTPAVPASTHAGVFRVDESRHLIVRPMGDRISILDTRTGQVRHLVQEPGDDSRYSHGPTRSQTTPISGTVAFPTDGGVTWRSRLLGELTGSRLSVNRSEVTVEAPGGTRLDGALYLPEDGMKRLVPE
jgi:hypothetical protein